MPLKVGVLGAGAVGAYVGGLIALRTKSDVVMVGRRRFVDQVSAGGMTLRPDPRRPRDVHSIRPKHVTVDDDPKALAGCDIILVAVKSTATADAAAQLERIAERAGSPHALVLSLQNGVGNGSILVGRWRSTGSPRSLAWSTSTSSGTRTRPTTFATGASSADAPPPSPHALRRRSDLPARAIDGAGLVDHPSVFAAKKANLAAFVEATRETGLVVSLERDILPVQYGKLLIDLQSPSTPSPELRCPRRCRAGGSEWRGARSCSRRWTCTARVGSNPRGRTSRSFRSCSRCRIGRTTPSRLRCSLWTRLQVVHAAGLRDWAHDGDRRAVRGDREARATER